jgi:MFS family permease
MTVALLLISFTFFSKGDNASAGFAVGGLALYLSFFSIGMGPGAWLIPSEIFATSIRAKAMSLATFFNRITATLMASTFLSTADAIGWAWFFLLLAGVCTIIFFFLFFLLPETKGRPLEEMSVYFAEITGDQSLLMAETKIIRGREASGLEMTTGQQSSLSTLTGAAPAGTMA